MVMGFSCVSGQGIFTYRVATKVYVNNGILRFAAGFFRRSVRGAAGADFLDARGVAVGVKLDDSHEVPLFVVISLLAAGFAVAVGHVASQRAVWVEVLNAAV